MRTLCWNHKKHYGTVSINQTNPWTAFSVHLPYDDMTLANITAANGAAGTKPAVTPSWTRLTQLGSTDRTLVNINQFWQGDIYYKFKITADILQTPDSSLVFLLLKKKRTPLGQNSDWTVGTSDTDAIISDNEGTQMVSSRTHRVLWKRRILLNHAGGTLAAGTIDNMCMYAGCKVPMKCWMRERHYPKYATAPESRAQWLDTDEDTDIRLYVFGQFENAEATGARIEIWRDSYWGASDTLSLE
jgi:hypothetical protein